jgi:hypothetical protein
MARALPKPDARAQRTAVAENSVAQRVPVTGRVGRPPSCPLPLGAAGQRWWRWAWSTPQATRWNKGFMEPLARRASLEDAYEQASKADNPFLERSRLLPTMLRMDSAFGLTPDAAASQHLVFVDEPQAPKVVDDETVTPLRPRLKGLRE